MINSTKQNQVKLIKIKRQRELNKEKQNKPKGTEIGNTKQL